MDPGLNRNAKHGHLARQGSSCMFVKSKCLQSWKPSRTKQEFLRGDSGLLLLSAILACCFYKDPSNKKHNEGWVGPEPRHAIILCTQGCLQRATPEQPEFVVAPWRPQGHRQPDSAAEGNTWPMSQVPMQCSCSLQLVPRRTCLGHSRTLCVYIYISYKHQSLMRVTKRTD